MFKTGNKQNSWLFYSVLSMMIALLAGCSPSQYHLNEGANEYRVAKKGKYDEKDNSTYSDFSSRYFKEADSSSILPSDTISIRLLQAYICDFREQASLTEKFGSDNPDVQSCGNGILNPDTSLENANRTRGEIAVVVKAFERTKGNGVALDYNSIQKDGRLIYYNEDVRESGQILNFSNLPVYGPIIYTGKPFYLEINILELDAEESKQVQTLLSSLANFGTQAYPPASPILNILDTLGGALVGGNKDDLEFRHQTEFDGYLKNSTASDEYRAPLAAGTYAYIRQEQRDRLAPWNKIALDSKTGYLYQTKEINGKPGCNIPSAPKNLTLPPCEPFRGRTWFTMKITKGEDATEQEVGQTMAEFLQANAEISKQTNAQIKASAKQLGEKIVQTSTFTQAKKHLSCMTIDAMNSKATNPTKYVKYILASEKLMKILCDDAAGVNTLSTNQHEYVIDKLKHLIPHSNWSELSQNSITGACAKKDRAGVLKKKEDGFSTLQNNLGLK